MLARGRTATVRGTLDRPRLWRATAALAGALLCASVLVCAQGSLTVLADPPAAAPSARTPPWARWCTHGSARQDRTRLAFCARVDGRVIGSTAGPGPREAHVAVLSDFHVVIVRLPDGAARPGWGAHVIAVGPLLRARDGEREVQAFSVGSS
jgi:hypothetical protein